MAVSESANLCGCHWNPSPCIPRTIMPFLLRIDYIYALVCKRLFYKTSRDQDYFFGPGRKTSCTTRTRIRGCMIKCTDKMTGYVINMDRQVESSPFQRQKHRHPGGQGPCILTQRTTIASDIHPTTISLVISPNRFGAPPSAQLFYLSSLLLSSILDCRPTRVSRPPIDGALHLRYKI